MRPETQRYQLITHIKLLQKLTLDLDSDEDGSDLEELYQQLDDCFHLLNNRYLLPRSKIPRSMVYQPPDLADIPRDNFKHIFRRTYSAFKTLSENIHSHSIFHNSSRFKQRDPSIQLAVALAQFGSNGNGTAIKRIQSIFGIGHGTICSYTKQIIKVLTDLESQFIQWQTKEQRIESSQVMHQEGFPGCIGFIDGTTIPVNQKPAMDGNHYYDRKKR